MVMPVDQSNLFGYLCKDTKMKPRSKNRKPSIIAANVPREMLFSDLRFGKTSAERESMEWPDLLVEGFFDPSGLIRAAKKNGPFLFLGYKGSGKSAIGEHLRLTAANDPTSFVRYLSLGDFPYTPFSKIVKGDVEPEAKYPTAWSWLLLLQIIDQLNSDMGCSLQHNTDAEHAIRELKSSGLLPTISLSHIIQVSTKRTFSFKLARCWCCEGIRRDTR